MSFALNFPNYTVESVTPGHPDKLCDQISDAILDAYLSQDPKSRVAVETMGAHDTLYIAGEITSTANVDVAAIARAVYHETGYTRPVQVVTNLVTQSPDISQGVNTGGAGDQGIMYGYASNETKEYLPKGVVLAHQLIKQLLTLRLHGDIPWLKPDGKSQVTLNHGRVTTILVSTQHDKSVSQAEIEATVKRMVMLPLLENDDKVELLVNPTGKFVAGGIEADTGVTGRKIMVDTYGGLIPHGGGAFSGKDATKVDRSGAYCARLAAKTIVHAGFAKQCLVSVAYAIGRAEPVMVMAVNEAGDDLSAEVNQRFDFRPQAIIERMGLRRPIFRATATLGHFGKPDLPWEKV
jgi:S-adenosylmethionine synthetase